MRKQVHQRVLFSCRRRWRPAPQARLCYGQVTAELVGSTAAAFLCCSALGYGHEQKRTSGAIVKPLLGSSSGPPPFHAPDRFQRDFSRRGPALGYGHEQKRTSGPIVKPLLGSSSGPPPSTPLTGSRETSAKEGRQE
ncbi:hypothetical protein MRX96_056596 [Rhipicephalus microplus]